MGQQLWGTTTLGGWLANPRLSRELRHALIPLLKFRQFVSIKEGWGKGVGDTLYFDKISAISTRGTSLVETDEIPQHQFSIARGTIALTEFGNSIPYTGKLEALSEFDIQNPTIRVLRDDMASQLDRVCGKEYKKTALKYTLDGTASATLDTRATSETLATAGNNHQSMLNVWHVTDLVSILKNKKIPKYDNENYVCIGSISLIKGLLSDPEWQSAVKYGDPERLFTGEVGRIAGCRFIEENNYLTDTLGSGADYGEGVIFGADAVMEGIAIPEEIRAKVPTDFGRSKALAWYAILGWEKMWNNGDSGQDDHIIHITSAI